MTRWLLRVLGQIHELAARRHIRFTLKAARELAEIGIGLDQEDAAEVIEHLTSADFAARLVSEYTGEWMYVFKPQIAEVVVYLKLVVRGDCIVVSFHSDREDEDE